MNDANPRYSYRSRRPKRGGIGVPYGALGIAALTGGCGALIGLMLPMHLIEAASWQLYLDQVVSAARPPLGATARLAAMLASAALLGGLGWLIARLLRVRTDNRLLDRLMARVRGLDSADEAGAPSLRAADRHPDAPARRPFSAARDIPVAPADPADDAPMWVDRDWSDDVAQPDELLLDASFDGAVVAGAGVAGDTAATVDPVETPSEPAVAPVFETGAESGAESRNDRIAEPVATAATAANIAATAAVPAQVVEPVTAAAAPAEPAPADVDPLALAHIVAAPSPVLAPAPEPLDLSVARLDELIARLEAGLTRKTTLIAQAELRAAAADGVATPLTATGPTLARGVGMPDDPAFPQDPALAAALATLRRMNGNPH